MDNPHMFDELTNRLNKVKRPDSGIHNSGEFIGDNENLEKSDEQADSGRDSDPAEPADATDGAAKKGGILKSFKKMFRIRRKSKGEKIKDDGKVITGQYKAVSEPEINMISSSSKEQSIPRSNTGMPKRYNDSPNVNDFTSDDEEARIDEKKSSLKDAPSFIRSSLRKLKLKKKKNGGMDSTEVTPTSVKKHNIEAPISPKKSPKKTYSSTGSSHSSDQTDPRSNSFTKDYNIETDETYSSGKDSGIASQPVVVDLKMDAQAWQPSIKSSAAKDKIRVAPRGRKRPSRVRSQAKNGDVSDRKSSLPQISEYDVSDGTGPIESKDAVLAGLPKNTVQDIPKRSTEDISNKCNENKLDTDKKRDAAKTSDDKIVLNDSDTVSIGGKQNVDEAKNAKHTEVHDQNFDSVITSLESIRNTPDVSIPNKSSSDSKSNTSTDTTIPPLSKLPSKSEKPETKQRSRENINNLYNTHRNTDTENSSVRCLLNTRGSIENLENKHISLKNSVSLGDLIINTKDASPTRRSKSLKFSNGTESGSQRKTFIEPLKVDSTEKKRYDKYHKHRSQTFTDNRDDTKHSSFSKSVEDVSLLNKENNRRSSHFIEPLPTPHRKEFSLVNRENLVNDTRLGIKDENIRKSIEHLKKSSSGHSLNETTFAITSVVNNRDPVIPYGDNISKEISNSCSDKPRKLQRKVTAGSKDDITSKGTTRKPRPQSVTIRSTDANIIFGKVSGAKSYGDIRFIGDLGNIQGPEKSKPLPPISKKSKPLVNAGKSKSVDKPVLANTSRSKSVDIQQVSNDKSEEMIANGDNNVPEFKRMSLRKTLKTDDYLLKETIGAVEVESDEVIEENPLLASIKTTLKHVEKTDVDVVDIHDTRGDKPEEINDQHADDESKTNLNQDKQLPSPDIAESKLLPVDSTFSVEIREKKDKAPEFHRISLKKVEKREDYLEKEPGLIISNEEQEDMNHKSETNENKTNSLENISSSNEVITNLPSPTDEDLMRDKPKPPVKAKPFQFQSHDVKGDENKIQSSYDKSKPAPLSQTNKLPYFRKSIDIQENPNPHGNVPAWIAMARERQRDEATEKLDEEVIKETIDKADDVTIENLVKPSALKPKPAPLPKPAPASKPDNSSQSTSPPATAKKPPPVSQRPSLGRFNAKTDLPKDACMVCGKTAYVLERCEVHKRTLHRSCAKCYICSRTLNLGDIFIRDDKVWCRQHR